MGISPIRLVVGATQSGYNSVNVVPEPIFSWTRVDADLVLS